MSALAGSASPRLHVAVVALDEQLRSVLTRRLAGLGHKIAPEAGAADLVLNVNASHDSSDPITLSVTDRARGAVGVLPLAATLEQLEAAIQAVRAGLSVRACTLDEPPVGEFAVAPEPQSASLLSPRELEVLAALIEGLANKAIARKLAISQHTVKFHLESLFRKLRVRSRSQAVSRGMKLLARMQIEI